MAYVSIVIQKKYMRANASDVYRQHSMVQRYVGSRQARDKDTTVFSDLPIPRTPLPIATMDLEHT